LEGEVLGVGRERVVGILREIDRRPVKGMHVHLDFSNY
jgi:hypothetical protein